MPKRKGLTSGLDRLFISIVKEYQAGLEDSNNPRLKIDVDEIVAFARQMDTSLRRKPERNLRISCQNALRFIQDHESDSESVDSAMAFDEEVPLVQVEDTNSMNRSLLGMYQQQNETKTQHPSEVKSAKSDNEPLPKPPIKRKLIQPKQENKKSRVDEKWPSPSTRLSDLGGIEKITQDLMQLIGMPLRHPEVYRHLGIDPPRGILLHGPPGCGKTKLAHAIAGELQVPFINIAAPVIVSGMSGESEKKIREVFEEAKELAPCVLFIDEIDAITPKRETAQREMERRIVAQLLTCMDGIIF